MVLDVCLLDTFA
ncbi:hypothetical protein NM092_003680 [Vibrio cholerae]|nr:hypothetical protein [Vibrio cholerae]